MPFQTRHSKSRLCPGPSATLNAESDVRISRDVHRAFPAPNFSNCEVGKAGGVTGARRAERIYAAQYLMALSSEHGGAEGVAAREGTGAQGAPNFFQSLLSTVAGTLGHTLCRAARNGDASLCCACGRGAATQAITILCGIYSAQAGRVTGAPLASPRSTS